MEIQIRDYRGVERADLTIEKITLVAGQNEQGKSCVAQAVQALVRGTAIIIPGVTKKGADVLVRDGADEARAVLKDGDDTTIIEWPKCDVSVGTIGALDCKTSYASAYAAGLSRPMDMSPTDRAKAFAGYMDAQPAKGDLEPAMIDAGYNAAAIDKTWKACTDDGWDDAHSKAKAYGANLKGRWEQVTGETYGAKKAEDWTPAHYTPDSWETKTAALERAEEALEDAIGKAAVTAAERDDLTTKASRAPELAAALDYAREERDKLNKRLSTLEEDRAELPPEPKAKANVVMPCPECGVELVIERTHEGKTLLKAYSNELFAAGDTQEVRKRRAELDGDIANVKMELIRKDRERDSVQQALEIARTAQKKLDEAGETTIDADAADRAREALRAATAALKADEAKGAATLLHADIAKNAALVALLAPEGIRRRVLARALDTFNGVLAGISESAGWPTVRIDESLDVHYGTRPVWAASKSGQWRARAVIQIAMAEIDKSAVVILDEADMLDTQGREGLFNMLHTRGLRALVCMTMNAKRLVPNLSAAGLGHSYWIDNGKVEPL